MKTANGKTTPLRLALAEDGRRQDWLASNLGVSPVTVCRWVQGVSMPSRANQIAIAKLLGRSIEALFFSDEDFHLPNENIREAA